MLKNNYIEGEGEEQGGGGQICLKMGLRNIWMTPASNIV